MDTGLADKLVEEHFTRPARVRASPRAAPEAVLSKMHQISFACCFLRAAARVCRYVSG